jgi:hypothetical protein
MADLCCNITPAKTVFVYLGGVFASLSVLYGFYLVRMALPDEVA